MEIQGFDKVLILWWKKNQNQNKTLTFKCYPITRVHCSFKNKLFLVDETILSDEELRQVKRRAKINFALGCTLAFICGLTMTVNNFIVKEVGTDFGVIMAIRGLLQPIVMFTIIAFEGL